MDYLPFPIWPLFYTCTEINLTNPGSYFGKKWYRKTRLLYFLEIAIAPKSPCIYRDKNFFLKLIVLQRNLLIVMINCYHFYVAIFSKIYKVTWKEKKWFRAVFICMQRSVLLGVFPVKLISWICYTGVIFHSEDGYTFITIFCDILATQRY